jgi:hypothetical protein
MVRVCSRTVIFAPLGSRRLLPGSSDSCSPAIPDRVRPQRSASARGTDPRRHRTAAAVCRAVVGVRVYGVPRTGVRIRVPLAVIPEDKIRFLKEFSFSSVMRVDRFEDFSFEELISVARGVIDRLPSVRSGTEKLFVNEIIDRSGLLSQTSLAHTSLQEEYIFAHRSVQEFLAARRLLGDRQAGAWLLLERVHHPEWRLITLFFASFEHDHVETLCVVCDPDSWNFVGGALR